MLVRIETKAVFPALTIDNYTTSSRPNGRLFVLKHFKYSRVNACMLYSAVLYYVYRDEGVIEMKLAKTEVKHGERLEGKQLDYLNGRYEKLEELIDSRYNRRVYFNASHMSEAAYAEIEMPNDETYTISLRNHINRETSSYDEALWFSSFDTYSEMKKEFIKKIDTIVKAVTL